MTAPDRLPRLGDDPTAEITASDPAISAYLTERNAARPRGSPPLSWDDAERELLEVARQSYCTRAGDQITTRYRSRNARRRLDPRGRADRSRGARRARGRAAGAHHRRADALGVRPVGERREPDDEHPHA